MIYQKEVLPPGLIVINLATLAIWAPLATGFMGGKKPTVLL